MKTNKPSNMTFEQQLFLMKEKVEELEQKEIRRQVQEEQTRKREKNRERRKKRTRFFASMSFVVVVGTFMSVWLAYAQSPFVYSGYLEEGGKPVITPRKVILSLWDASQKGNKKCTKTYSQVIFVNGRFQLTLDSSCLTVLHRHQTLWIELEIYSKDGKTSKPLTRARLSAVPYANRQVPVGTLLAFAGPLQKIPSGWIHCDGKAISRSEYTELFQVIGISHGHGDKSTTFNLPDYRGRFLRGVDHNKGRDPDRSSRTHLNPGGNKGDQVGSLQTDAFRKHFHDIGLSRKLAGNAYKSGESAGVSPAAGSGLGYGGRSTLNKGGSETRPTNVYVNYIIKY